MSGRYWVHVNTPTNRATIHAAACGHCNDGGGQDKPKGIGNSEWQGPLCSIREAQVIAERSGHRPHFCEICLPDEPSI